MSEDYLVLFAKNLIKIRQKKGLSQKELSEKSKIPLNYIKKIEVANNPRMKISHVIKLAEALGVNFFDLLP